MEADTFGEIFPLAETAELETIEWLLSIATEQQYPEDKVILRAEEWGNAVYFIISGWVKLQEHTESRKTVLAVLGQGDFFGEMAILDESLRDTEVVSLSAVTLLEVPAQRFIQLLFKDAQLHHRFLQRSMQRLRKLYRLHQLRHEPAMVRVAYVLSDLAESYGSDTGEGVNLHYLAPEEIADLAGSSIEETKRVLEKWQEKHWIYPDRENKLLLVNNPRQLSQLCSR